MRYRRLLPFLTRFNYHLGSHKLHANPADISCQPFFILGSGRNGSTLLSMILNGHSKIFLPNEQFALHYAAIRYQLYNFLIWRDLVKLVIGEFADNNNNQAWNTNFNALYGKLFDLPKREQSFQKIIDEIIKEVAKQNGEYFSVWGDKSPPTTDFLQYVYRVYPKSKYIFLIRDGRDVASSYADGEHQLFGELSNIKNAAIKWHKSIQQWNWLNKQVSSSQLLEIRYEDLVNKPEGVIKIIFEFLGLSYERALLDFNSIALKRKVLEIPYHQGLSQPIHNESIGKWKNKLTREDLTLIMPFLERGLKKYNYT